MTPAQRAARILEESFRPGRGFRPRSHAIRRAQKIKKAFPWHWQSYSEHFWRMMREALLHDPFKMGKLTSITA